ncbi:MAG: hypothetical protein HOP12_02480 [Candidatus Eisenbacteria bacterium]|uniref:T9SS type A sorting domain-containing protein n=1 Tax=Eiseniibacteriota bacterium TaxID=2212470 RepID=A0A849SEZ8_UNCEI|nr:hypothetical protein [Candidatus Eisenbacteria bacterium]
MRKSPPCPTPASLGAILPAIALAALTLLTPSLAWSWGSQTHQYIARNYSKHLPPVIDGLRTYDAFVEAHVNDPDIRRSSTPGEGPRHFIDIDVYPEFFLGTLPHDRATLEAIYGAAFVLDTGIVPWAVGEVVTTLSQQFAAQNWSGAATTIADLCHYVGDSSQPLHCTQNYNGQLTGNTGIHSRYETSMINPHIAELNTPAATTVFYPNVVDAMFDFVGISWTGVSPLLSADNTAKTASGGLFNSTYYNSLWASTQVMTRERVNAATLATASFVYTAWRNAGEPAVPGSSVGVGPSALTIARLDAWPMPFRSALNVRFDGSGPFTVDVFDIRGARVTRLVEQAASPGMATWTPGGRVEAGIYFLRLTTPEKSLVRRVTLLD